LHTTIFDIETTGLSYHRDRLVCASFCDPADGKLLQFFADDPAEEKELLGQIIDELNKYDAVISYNGASFDLPFVYARGKKYGLVKEQPLFWSIDLYRWVKKYWPVAASMDSLTQKSLEDALGLASRRTDLIDGGECISLYARWCQGCDQDAKDKILLHNGDDVRQLGRIGHSLAALPYHRIAFENGFFVKGRLPLVLEPAAIKGNRLMVKGKTQTGQMAAEIYDDAYRYSYDPDTGQAELTIELTEAMGALFTDLKALPLNPEEFTDLQGYHDGFLIISENGTPLYREITLLIRKIAERII